DGLMVPQSAKNVRALQDGVIVMTRNHGASRETLQIGFEMKTAAAKLKSLDSDFQKTLLKLIRSPRTADLTVGHKELNESSGDAAEEGRTGKMLRKLLESQNYTVKDLGLTQGLANDIPKDAHVV